MVIEKCGVTNYATGASVRLYTNAAHVEINDGKNILFKRDRSSDDNAWYDAKHQKIVNALHALENAVLEAVNLDSPITSR